MIKEAPGDGGNGFSLIEVMVASVIASIILIMVHSAYRSTIRSIRSITGYAEFYENVNLAIMKMDRDMSNAYFNRKNEKVCFIGEMDGENSKLNFVTVSHNDFNVMGDIRRQNPVSDVRETGYYLTDDAEYPGVHFLVKREERHYDDEPERGGEENIILENVVGLKFEFRLRNDWTDNWDSRKYRKLPNAVKTTIRLKSYDETEEEFSFISSINVL